MSLDDSRRAVRTERAPIPLGGYSQGVVSGGLLFVSGQVPIDPATKTVPTDFADQVRQALNNVGAIAEAAGARLTDAVRVGCLPGQPRRLQHDGRGVPRVSFMTRCRPVPRWAPGSGVRRRDRRGYRTESRYLKPAGPRTASAGRAIGVNAVFGDVALPAMLMKQTALENNLVVMSKLRR